MIKWRDAFFDLDAEAVGDYREDYIVDTVGFLVPSSGSKFVHLAQEQLPDGDGYRAVTHIPVELIVARIVLSSPEATQPKEIATWTS